MYSKPILTFRGSNSYSNFDGILSLSLWLESMNLRISFEPIIVYWWNGRILKVRSLGQLWSDRRFEWKSRKHYSVRMSYKYLNKSTWLLIFIWNSKDDIQLRDKTNIWMCVLNYCKKREWLSYRLKWFISFPFRLGVSSIVWPCSWTKSNLDQLELAWYD